MGLYVLNNIMMCSKATENSVQIFYIINNNTVMCRINFSKRSNNLFFIVYKIILPNIFSIVLPIYYIINTVSGV